MRVKKDIILMFSNITVIFAAIQLVFALVSKSIDFDSKEFWFSNIFRDAIYVFIMIPVYFLTASYIDKFFSVFSVVRINNIKKSIFLSLKYKIGVAFVLVSEWFAFISILSVIFFDITKEDLLHCIFGFFCYILGFISSVIFAEIFKRSEIRMLKSNPYFFTNLIIALEILVLVPELSRSTPFELPIIFCWVFYWDMRGIIALLLIDSVLAVYLFNVSSKKDII